EETRPWLLANPGKPEHDLEACRRVLVNLVEAVRVAAILLRPFMPRTAEKLYGGFSFSGPFEKQSLAQIVERPAESEDLRVTAELVDGKLPPMFPKIEPQRAAKN
ncbi:MAG: hypothetical protein AB7U73_21985, partial [Pirellulales bacterium]